MSRGNAVNSLLVYQSMTREIRELVDALRMACLQIEYLHDKFQKTGSGAAALVALNGVLEKYEPKESRT